MQKQDGVENFIRLDDFSFRHISYTYVDVSSYLFDKIAVKHKIRLKIKKEFVNKQNDYVIVICKVLKKEEESFLIACKELFAVMHDNGYDDYEDMCSHIQESVNTNLLS